MHINHMPNALPILQRLIGVVAGSCCGQGRADTGLWAVRGLIRVRVMRALLHYLCGGSEVVERGSGLLGMKTV
jgi:hypothetical protein